MSSEALRKLEVDQELYPLRPAPNAAAMLRFPLRENPGIESTDDCPKVNPSDGNPLIGLGIAMTLEAGAAIVLFGAWQLFRFLR
jgi:hypothetical protein